MAVVVVESPAKAKTINKYLGSDFTVLASYGHVRDLPPKDGSVDPEQDFRMEWEVAPESKKHVRAIAEALKSDDTLILATDPDREGEAISWHLKEALASSIKKGKKVARVTFNAITKDAVTKAMKEPREVDEALVDAYLARRALDYLVGFNLSPVLWRKVQRGLSAGRVQSPALRMIVEREEEIEAFKERAKHLSVEGHRQYNPGWHLALVLQLAGGLIREGESTGHLRLLCQMGDQSRRSRQDGNPTQRHHREANPQQHRRNRGRDIHPQVFAHHTCHGTLQRLRDLYITQVRSGLCGHVNQAADPWIHRFVQWMAITWNRSALCLE